VGRQHQRGQAIVLIAVTLAVVVGMAALAIDGARAYALRRDTQAAVDAAALAAGDKFQQTGSYSGAEQAASMIFGTNLRLYNTPSCSPGYGAPGASPITVACTYSDGSVLTQVVSALGAQGSEFRLTATRSLPLQFARILTSGGNPTITGAATGRVNNQLNTPVLGALDQAGCGGAGGSAITVSGSGGTVYASGDVVSNGGISISSATLRVTGDVYARCQSSVAGVVTACYPSGASTPCTYPDVAGAIRSGSHLADPNFPPPSVTGGSQGLPSGSAVLSPGVYASNPNFTSGHCWFLSGGAYEWLGGYTNTSDFASNELKPPDEAVVGNNTVRSSYQFWNTRGFNCAGSFTLDTANDARNPLHNGLWGVELTSVRTDMYRGTTYLRESAPSMCRSINTATRNDILVEISNVPGATSYNVYLAPPSGGCNGPFGFVGNIPVTGTVSNNLTPPCPIYLGGGCSLGNEQLTIDQVYLGVGWAPNFLAPPDTSGAPPPDSETTPLQSFLPNENPNRGPGSTGDRANENLCESAGGAFATCPASVTPGAVEFYLPSGGCMNLTGGGDNYVFSGYQYNWVVLYEPGPANGPANTCSNVLGAAGNSAFVGYLYMPSAIVSLPSSWLFESNGMGGLLADMLTITGSPSFSYYPGYAPVPPASRLTG
jgi:putative Flp pilus-assembly TadE/G-like protein